MCYDRCVCIIPFRLVIVCFSDPHGRRLGNLLHGLSLLCNVNDILVCRWYAGRPPVYTFVFMFDAASDTCP
jgi:hypothetical protein